MNLSTIYLYLNAETISILVWWENENCAKLLHFLEWSITRTLCRLGLFDQVSDLVMYVIKKNVIVANPLIMGGPIINWTIIYLYYYYYYYFWIRGKYLNGASLHPWLLGPHHFRKWGMPSLLFQFLDKDMLKKIGELGWVWRWFNKSVCSIY